MKVRTKRKDTTFRDDLFTFTNKPIEVPDSVGRDYGSHPNLEVVEDKKQAKEEET